MTERLYLQTILVNVTLSLTMMLPVIILQLIILVTSSPQPQNTEIIDNAEVGLPMAQALVDGENSDLGKYLTKCFSKLNFK